MGLFSKKDKPQKEKPNKISKNKTQEVQQGAVESPEDEIARLDSQLGIELLHTGYMMIPQKRLPNGESIYLSVITKHATMFYASDSISAYEQFARKIQEQNGGSPDKVQCLEIKNGNHRDFGLSKTTFSEAVKILDSTEGSEGFLYLLQDGRGLRLTTRMVRELSRRYSILEEMRFEEEDKRQREEYRRRTQAQRPQQYDQYQSGYGYEGVSQSSANYSHQPTYSQPSRDVPTTSQHSASQQISGTFQKAPTYVQVDGVLRQHFGNMLDKLWNVDAFNLWSAAEIYAIGYVMDRMYNSGDLEYYKSKIKTWVNLAKHDADTPKTLALMIMMEIYERLSADANATDRDIQTAKNKYEIVRKRSDDDMSFISFGIVPKHCVPAWCVDACNEYATQKKEELQDHFVNTCVENGMNAQVAQKYYDMLSVNHKLVILELDYCLRTNKFKKYGAQKLPDPKGGEMLTIEEMLRKRNSALKEGGPQFKKTIISGYVRVCEAASRK